jgi:uncharacterized protein (DUF486 family)
MVTNFFQNYGWDTALIALTAVTIFLIWGHWEMGFHHFLIHKSANQQTYTFWQKIQYENCIEQNILNFFSLYYNFCKLALRMHYYLYYCVLRTKVCFSIPLFHRLKKRYNKHSKASVSRWNKQRSFTSSYVPWPLFYLPTLASSLLLNRNKLFPTSGLYISTNKKLSFVSF